MECQVEAYDSTYASQTDSQPSQDTTITSQGEYELPPVNFLSRKVTKLKTFEKNIPDHVLDRFKDLRAAFDVQLFTYLLNNKVHNKVVSIRLKILGESKASAKPWIVVLCDKSALKKIKRFFKLPDVKSEYATPHGDSKRPPFSLLVTDTPPRLVAANQHVAILNRTLAQFAEAATLCGTVVTVDNQSATIGGVIKVQRADGSFVFYAVTVAHVLCRQPESGSQQSHVVNTTTDEHRDNMDMTIAEDYGDNDDAESDESDSSSDDESFVLDLDDDLFLCAPPHPTASSIDNKAMSVSEIGVITQSSVDSQSQPYSGLDWSLLELHNPAFYKPNVFTVPSTQQTLLINPDIILEDDFLPDKTRAVWLLGGVSGVRRATLSTCMSSLLTPSAQTPVSIFTISIEDGLQLQTGDSGSWVIDHHTLKVYGHVVAADAFGDGYVVPLSDILDEVRGRLQATSVTLLGQEAPSLETGELHGIIPAGNLESDVITLRSGAVPPHRAAASSPTSGVFTPVPSPLTVASHIPRSSISTAPSLLEVCSLPTAEQDTEKTEFLTTEDNETRLRRPLEKIRPAQRREPSAEQYRRRYYPLFRIHRSLVSDLPVVDSGNQSTNSLFEQKRDTALQPEIYYNDRDIERRITKPAFDLRKTFHEVIVSDVDSSDVEQTIWVWYLEYMDARICDSWQGLIAPAIGASDFNDRPTAAELNTFYATLTEIASSIQATSDISLVDIMKQLRQRKLLPNTGENKDIIQLQMVFRFVGLLTMLYDPVSNSSDNHLQLRKTTSSRGSRGRSRGQGIVFSSTNIVEACAPLHRLLGKFGALVPDVRRSTVDDIGYLSMHSAQESHQPRIYPSYLSFHLLSQITGLKIEWVDTLNLHLQFDERKRILQIFRFPSYCKMVYRGASDKSLLSTIYHDHKAEVMQSRLQSRDFLDVSDFLRETMLSYRLIFGMHRQSRKAFREITKDWKTSGYHWHNIDPLLLMLCTETADSPKLSKLLATIDGDESPHRLTSYEDFPFLGSRLKRLQNFSESHDTRWRLLWADRRDRQHWWTVWAVLLIGGGTLMLQFLQLVFQALSPWLQS